MVVLSGTRGDRFFDIADTSNKKGYLMQQLNISWAGGDHHQLKLASQSMKGADNCLVSGSSFLPLPRPESFKILPVHLSRGG